MEEQKKQYNIELYNLKKMIVIMTIISGIIWLLASIFISNIVFRIVIPVFVLTVFGWISINFIKKFIKYEEFIYRGEDLESEISGLADSVEKASEKGFFDKISTDGNKDIIRISKSFNTLLSNISEFINEVDNISEDSFATSRDLTDVAEKTSGAMNQVNDTLVELAATTQELSSSIIDISDGAKEVDSLSQDGLKQLQTLEEEMREIITAANKAGERIIKLKNSTDEIDEIISVITNIAEQTNLLALNAAIEAARAGEYGRGFNVVADEIRQLSQDTQESLQAVSEIVYNLTQETTQTVEIINSNNQKIEAGEKTLEETSGRFKVIADNIQSMVMKIDEAASASEQISAGSQEISAITEQQATSAREFTDLARNLAEMAADFKNKMADTSIGGVKLDIDLNKYDREMKKITTEQQNKLKNKFNLYNKFVIGMIARLEPVKGHKFFFKGLEQVLKKHSNVVCLIVGDGSLEDELQEFIEARGLTDHILFLGYRKDINLILSICDLVVLTSKKEGMPPNILLEAMAASRAIIATEVNGTKYIINNKENGLLVKYNDINGLQNSLKYFINDPDKCEKYGIKGRKRLEELL